MKTHLVELFHHIKSWHLPVLWLLVSSVQSCLSSDLVMSDSLLLQHARLSCPSPVPEACANSCPLSWWGHPTISSSVVPVSSWLQSFPASGSFPRSQFFTSGGLSIVASASVLPVNIQDWFPLGLTGWISLQSKGLLRKRAILSYKESIPKDIYMILTIGLLVNTLMVGWMCLKKWHSDEMFFVVSLCFSKVDFRTNLTIL